jgi:hypothetical protein
MLHWTRFASCPDVPRETVRTLILMGLRQRTANAIVYWTHRKISSLLAERGPIFTVAYFKAATKVAGGEILIPTSHWNKNGTGILFSSKIKSLFRAGKRRELVTCFSMFRVLNVDPVLDYESITNPGVDSESYGDLLHKFKSIVKVVFPLGKKPKCAPVLRYIARRVWMRKPEKVNSHSFGMKKHESLFKDKTSNKKISVSRAESSYIRDKHPPKEVERQKAPLMWSTSAGPNGHAMSTVSMDASAIINDKELYQNVSKAWKYFGLDLESAISDIKPLKTSSFIHCRIVALPDKACKTRMVAIGDYFSQISLCFVHQKCMNILRALPSDGTHNHRKAADELRLSGNKFFGSLDLKSATDRFPMSFQVLIVERLFPGFSSIWSKVCSDRDFYSSIGPLRYEVGQPMGFLSSWPVFALTHHIFTLMCSIIAHPNRINYKWHHKIVGDDVVITDSRTFLVYKELMTRIGVDYTEPRFKGVKSFEFCKRIIFNREDVSPISRNCGSSDIVKVKSELLMEGIIPNRRIFGRLNWHHLSWKIFLYTPGSPFGNKWGIEPLGFSRLIRRTKEVSLLHWVKKVLPRTRGSLPRKHSGIWFLSQCQNWQRDWMRLARSVENMSEKSFLKKKDLIAELSLKTTPYQMFLSGKTSGRSARLSEYLILLKSWRSGMRL